MSDSTIKIAVWAWGFLMVATLATGWVAEHDRAIGQWAVLLVMAVAAIKARVVILHYMELKHAPIQWRLAFEAWVLVASLLIVVFWVLS